MTESCEHHKIKRLCSKCNPRPKREPSFGSPTSQQKRPKGRVLHTTKDPETGEEVKWHLVMTTDGLLVRRKHCRKRHTKLFTFDTLVSLLDFTFTARAQAKTEAPAKPLDQYELFPATPEQPTAQTELTLT